MVPRDFDGSSSCVGARWNRSEMSMWHHQWDECYLVIFGYLACFGQHWDSIQLKHCKFCFGSSWIKPLFSTTEATFQPRLGPENSCFIGKVQRSCWTLLDVSGWKIWENISPDPLCFGGFILNKPPRSPPWLEKFPAKCGKLLGFSGVKYMSPSQILWEISESSN